jgi:hypothetical protein
MEQVLEFLALRIAPLTIIFFYHVQHGTWPRALLRAPRALDLFTCIYRAGGRTESFGGVEEVLLLQLPVREHARLYHCTYSFTAYVQQGVLGMGLVTT